MQHNNVQYTQSYMPKRWLRVRLVVRKHRYKLRYLPVASGLEKAQTTVHYTV